MKNIVYGAWAISIVVNIHLNILINAQYLVTVDITFIDFTNTIYLSFQKFSFIISKYFKESLLIIHLSALTRNLISNFWDNLI